MAKTKHQNGIEDIKSKTQSKLSSSHSREENHQDTEINGIHERSRNDLLLPRAKTNLSLRKSGSGKESPRPVSTVGEDSSNSKSRYVNTNPRLKSGNLEQDVLLGTKISDIVYPINSLPCDGKSDLPGVKAYKVTTPKIETHKKVGKESTKSSIHPDGSTQKIIIFDNLQQAISAIPKSQKTKTPIVCIKDCLKSASNIETQGLFEAQSESCYLDSSCEPDLHGASQEKSEEICLKTSQKSYRRKSNAELKKAKIMSNDKKGDNSLIINSTMQEDKVLKACKSKGEKEKQSPRQKQKNVKTDDIQKSQPRKKSARKVFKDDSSNGHQENTPEKKRRKKVKESPSQVSKGSDISMKSPSCIRDISVISDPSTPGLTSSMENLPHQKQTLEISASPTDLRQGRRIRSPSVRYADDMILFPLKSPRRSRSPKGSAEKEIHTTINSGGETDEKVSGTVSSTSSPDDKNMKTAESQTSQLYSLLTQEKGVKGCSPGGTDISPEKGESKTKNKKTLKKENESTPPSATKSPKGKRKNSSGKDSSEKKAEKQKAKQEDDSKSLASNAVRELKFEKDKKQKVENLTESSETDVVNIAMEINGKGKKIELTVPKICKYKSEPTVSTRQGKGTNNGSLKQCTQGKIKSDSEKHKKTSKINEKEDSDETKSVQSELSGNRTILGLFDLIAKVKSNMKTTKNLPGITGSSSYCDLVTEPEEAGTKKTKEDIPPQDMNSSDSLDTKLSMSDDRNENCEENRHHSDTTSENINDDFFSVDFLQTKQREKSPKKDNHPSKQDNLVPISTADVILVDQATSSSVEISENVSEIKETKALCPQNNNVDSTVTMETEVGFSNVNTNSGSPGDEKMEPLSIDIQERRNIFDAIMNDYHSPKSETATKTNKEGQPETAHLGQEKSDTKDDKILDDKSTLHSENKDINTIKKCTEIGSGKTISTPKSIIEKIQEKLRLTMDDSHIKSKPKSKVQSSIGSPAKPAADSDQPHVILETLKPVLNISMENKKSSKNETSEFEIVIDTVDDHQEIPEYDEQMDSSPVTIPTPPSTSISKVVSPKCLSQSSPRAFPKCSTQRKTVEPVPLSVLKNLEMKVEDKACAFVSEKLDAYLEKTLGMKLTPVQEFEEDDSVDNSLSDDSTENIVHDEVPDDTGEGVDKSDSFSPIINDCDPDFDEVDGILFVSFPNPEALEAHLKVERKTKIGKNEHLLLGMARMKNLRQKQRQIQSTVHKKKWARLKALKAQYKIHQSLQGMHLVLAKYQRVYRKELILTLMAKEQQCPGSVQMRKPKKTSDVTKIKGWKNKFGNNQGDLSSGFKLQPSKKLHWRTEESLVKNLHPQELKEMGLELKKKRRKNLIFTKRKGMSKGDGSKVEKVDENLIDEETVGVIHNGLDNNEGSAMEIGQGIGQGILEMGNEILDFDRQKCMEKKLREKQKRYLMLKLRMTNEDIDILKKLGGQRLRTLKPSGMSYNDVECPEKTDEIESVDGAGLDGDSRNSDRKKRRKRKKNLFQIITLTNSMSNAALSALDPRFVKKKKRQSKNVTHDVKNSSNNPSRSKSSPNGPNVIESASNSRIPSPVFGSIARKGPEDDCEKTCDKPGCRYGCICHLCKFGEASPETESTSNCEKPKCTKEYCRLGCICESTDLGRENEHCGKPECMFDCKCKPSRFQTNSCRSSLSSNDGFQPGNIEKMEKGDSSTCDKAECSMSVNDDADNCADGLKSDDKKKFINNKKGQDRYAALPKRTSTYRLAKNLDAVSRKALLEYETSEKYAEIKSNKGKSERNTDVRNKVRKRQDSQDGQTQQTKFSIATTPQLKVISSRSNSSSKDSWKPESLPEYSSTQMIAGSSAVITKSSMKKSRKQDFDLRLFDSDSEVEEYTKEIIPSCARTSIYVPVSGREKRKCTCGQYHQQQVENAPLKTEETKSKPLKGSSSPICISPVNSGSNSPVPVTAKPETETSCKVEEMTPATGWHTQWVCLKNNKKSESGNVRLLEIMSNCNWDPYKQKILSIISAQIQKDSYPEPKSMYFGDYSIEFLKKSDKPTIIPSQVKATLPPAVFSVRVKVSKTINRNAVQENCKHLNTVVKGQSVSVSKFTNQHGVDNKIMPKALTTGIGSGISGLSRLQINRGSKPCNVTKDSPPVHTDMSHWTNKSLVNAKVSTGLVSLPNGSAGKGNVSPKSLPSQAIQHVTKPTPASVVIQCQFGKSGQPTTTVTYGATPATTDSSLPQQSVELSTCLHQDINKPDVTISEDDDALAVVCPKEKDFNHSNSSACISPSSSDSTPSSISETNILKNTPNKRKLNDDMLSVNTSVLKQSTCSLQVKTAAFDANFESASKILPVHCSVQTVTTTVSESIIVTACASDLIMTNSVIDSRPVTNTAQDAGVQKSMRKESIKASEMSDGLKQTITSKNKNENGSFKSFDIKKSPVKKSSNLSCKNKVDSVNNETADGVKCSVQNPAIINAAVSSPLKNTTLGALKPAVSTLQEKKCIIGPRSTPVTLIGPFDSPANIPLTLPQMKILKAKELDKDGKPILHLIPLNGKSSGITSGLIPVSISLTSTDTKNVNTQPLTVTADKSVTLNSVCTTDIHKSCSVAVTCSPTVCSLFSVSDNDAVPTVSDCDTKVTSSSPTSRSSVGNIQNTSKNHKNSNDEHVNLLPTAGDQILLVSSRSEKRNDTSPRLGQRNEVNMAADSSIEVKEVITSKSGTKRKIEYEKDNSESGETASRKKSKTNDVKDQGNTNANNASSDVMKDMDSVLAKILSSKEHEQAYVQSRNVQNGGIVSQKDPSNEMKVEDSQAESLKENQNKENEEKSDQIGDFDVFESAHSSLENSFSKDNNEKAPATSTSGNTNVIEDESDTEMNDEPHLAASEGSELDSSCDNKSDDTDATVVGGIDAECKDLDSEQSNMGIDDLSNEAGSDVIKQEVIRSDEKRGDIIGDETNVLSEEGYCKSEKQSSEQNERGDKDIIYISDSPVKKVDKLRGDIKSRHPISDKQETCENIIEIDDEGDVQSGSKDTDRKVVHSSEKRKSSSKLNFDKDSGVSGIRVAHMDAHSRISSISKFVSSFEDTTKPSPAKKMRINSGGSHSSVKDNLQNSSLCIAIEDSDDVAVVIPDEDTQKCVEIIDSEEEEIDVETDFKVNTTQMLLDQVANSKDTFSPDCHVHGMNKQPKSLVACKAKRKATHQTISNDDIEFKEGVVLAPLSSEFPNRHKVREKQRRMALQLGFRKLAEAMYGHDEQNSRYAYLLTHCESKIQLLGKAKQTIDHLTDLEKRFIIAQQTWTAKNILLKCRLGKLKDYMIEKRKMPWMVLQAHLDKISKVCSKIFMNMPAILRKRAAEKQKMEEDGTAEGKNLASGNAQSGQHVTSYESGGTQSTLALLPNEEHPDNSANQMRKFPPFHTGKSPVPVQLVTAEEVKKMAQSNKAREQNMSGIQSKSSNKKVCSATPDIYIDYAEEDSEIYQDIMNRQEYNDNVTKVRDDTVFDIGDLPRILDSKNKFISEVDYAMETDVEDNRDILDEVTGELIHITDNDSQESQDELEQMKSVTTFQVNHNGNENYLQADSKNFSNFLQVPSNHAGAVVEVSMSDKGEVSTESQLSTYHQQDSVFFKGNDDSEQMLVISDVKSLSFEEL